MEINVHVNKIRGGQRVREEEEATKSKWQRSKKPKQKYRNYNLFYETY